MKKLYAIAACSLCLAGAAQNNLEATNKLIPSITRPSPTVAQLMKVEESTLDHYTGQPQIAVPLFSTKAGNLDVGLTLSYNSSGIRVNEISGWTGKGWSLETGGVISRSVVDLPDEIDTDNHKGANADANILHDFFNYDENSAERRAFAYNSQWGTRVRLDTKTDIYQFSFFGRTGRFVFTKIGNILKPAIIGNDNDYKIEVEYRNNPLPTMYPKEISSFIITDETGNRYHFKEIERTLKTDITLTHMQEGCNDPVAPIHSPTIQKFISAWHLSKVEDANGIILLNITYTDVLEKPQSTKSRTDYVAENLQSVFIVDSQACNEQMRCALEPSSITSESYRDIDTKKISRISFPDGSNIRFFLSASHPEYRDGKGAYLTKIEVFNAQDTVAVTSFDFVYSGALFLDSVKTKGSDIDRYAFEYFKRDEYPEYDSEFRDVFGYASLDTRTGVLTKISYPTKGVREFEWEPNTYSYKGNKLLTFSEIFTNPDNYSTDPTYVNDPFMNDGANILRPFDVFYVTVEQNAMVYSGTYSAGTFGFLIPNSVKIVPIRSMTDHTIDTNRPDLSYPIGTNETINRTIHFKPGAYRAYFWSANITDSNTEKISGHIDIRVKKPKQHLNWFVYGGGVRIKGIKDKDRDIDQIVKGFAYNFENPGTIPTDLPPYPYLGNGYTLSFSSGSLDGIDNLVREYSADVLPIFNLPAVYIHPEQAITYRVTEKQNEIDAQLQKGSFIGYKNVFEYVYPNTGSAMLYKSKIRYVFDSPIDFPSVVTTSATPIPIRGDEYKQSNVRKIEYFGSGTGLLVSEDFKYNYDIDDIKIFVKKNLHFIINATTISGSCQQVRKLFTSYQNLQSNFISAAQYDLDCNGGPSALSERFQNMDKTSCIDALSENYMSVDDYRYKSQVMERTKKEYFPAGPLETKQTFAYRNNFKRLNAQTSISSTGQLLETRYLYPQDPEMATLMAPYRTELIARNMTGVKLRTESYRNGNQISVQEIRYGMFSLPADTNIPAAPALGNALLPQYIYAGKENVPPMEKKLTFNSYDSRANITQYTQDSGVPVSFVWGYKNSQPLAKIDNMAYASLPAGLITAVQNKSDAIGASYNEAALLSALEDLRISASASGALMTGYSYRPLLGISATIDPKGERTYYYYDAFGRLEIVRDRDANILSHNKYQYRIQN